MRILQILNFIKLGGVVNTLKLNFKALPIQQALHLPIIVGKDIEIKGIHRGCIECYGGTGSVLIGINQGSFSMHRGIKSRIDFSKRGKLTFKGKAVFYKCFHMYINGNVHIGNDFHGNTGFVLSCGDSISFGDGCLLGWNVTVIDGDGHKLLRNGKPSCNQKGVSIGNNCWLAANVTVLKGVQLKPHTIVPFGSVLTRSNKEEYTVFNNNVLKTDMDWRH